jgi:hypothetical protein
LRRMILPVILASLAVALLAAPASAGRKWCLKDPIVSLNGSHLQLWIAIPEEYVYLVNGPIAVTYRVPRDVSRSVVLLDEGFNGYGETVAFVDGDAHVNPAGIFDVEIQVVVPIDEQLAAGVIEPSAIPLRLMLNDEGKRKRNLNVVNNGTWVTTKVKGAR